MGIDKVKAAFGIYESGKKLEGGQGTAIKFGEVVLKPIEDKAYYAFTANLWNKLEPKGYRVSKPVYSKNGNLVESGYGATKYEPANGMKGSVKEKLEVSDKLHKDLSELKLEKLPYNNDPWTTANNILWKKGKLPKNIIKKNKKLCRRLLKKIGNLEEDYQLIHCDLAGNIFFDESLPPLVIDFSPAIAPKKYADAVIVCDSIAWLGEDIKELKNLTPLEEYLPYLKRAVLFRVLVMAILEKKSYKKLLREWKAYKKIWEAVFKY